MLAPISASGLSFFSLVNGILVSSCGERSPGPLLLWPCPIAVGLTSPVRAVLCVPRRAQRGAYGLDRSMCGLLNIKPKVSALICLRTSVNPPRMDLVGATDCLATDFGLKPQCPRLSRRSAASSFLPRIKIKRRSRKQLALARAR